MTDTSDPARTALATTDAAPPALDAHGFDPGAYDWIPVRRQLRADGWSEEKQRLFIGTLADTGSVREAARTVGMSAKSAYALRRAPDGAGFAAAWTAAIRQAMDRLIDVCLDRALEGSEDPIVDSQGERDTAAAQKPSGTDVTSSCRCRRGTPARLRRCSGMTRSLALLAALPLAACQQAAAPANTAAPAEHGYIAKVAALTPREREGVLFRAIQSGGGAACQGVKQVEDLPRTPQNQPAWRVTCDDGYQWAVVLADDGTATVTGARTDG